MFGIALAQYLQIVAAFIGLGGTLGVYWRSNARQRVIQRAETYLKLEMESSRIFEIARNNARLIAFIDGKFIPETQAERDELEHQVAWYFPQILNLFEVSISFYQRKIFEGDIFSTWVSWFLEVASADAFCHAWKELRPHYKSDLRDVMDCGIKAGDKLREGVDDEKVARWFFERVAEIVSDADILTYFDRSRPIG